MHSLFMLQTSPLNNLRPTLEDVIEFWAGKEKKIHYLSRTECSSSRQQCPPFFEQYSVISLGTHCLDIFGQRPTYLNLSSYYCAAVWMSWMAFCPARLYCVRPSCLNEDMQGLHSPTKNSWLFTTAFIHVTFFHKLLEIYISNIKH